MCVCIIHIYIDNQLFTNHLLIFKMYSCGRLQILILPANYAPYSRTGRSYDFRFLISDKLIRIPSKLKRERL